MANKKKTFHSLPVCNVGYGKRFIAFIIDYYVGLLCCSFPIVIANGIINQSDHMQMNVLLFDGITLYSLAFVSLLIGFWFYIYLPCKVWKGQTLGKRMMHFKMIRNDGKAVSYKDLWLRYGLGMLIIEGSIISCSSIIRQTLTYATGINLVDPFIRIGFIITIFSCITMLFSQNRLMLHDRIASTLVVLEDKV